MKELYQIPKKVMGKVNNEYTAISPMSFMLYVEQLTIRAAVRVKLDVNCLGKLPVNTNEYARSFPKCEEGSK